MRLDRADGSTSDHVFADLPDLLRPGDLLVLNDTRVVPAKFRARRPTAGRIEGLFLRQRDDGCWSVLLRNAGRCREGERLTLTDQRGLVLVERGREGHWVVRPDPPAPAMDVLADLGVTPLPPYIRRPGPMVDRADRGEYQTVFARKPGAVAAPTAGLHFTDELFVRLADRGVDRTFVTLHVGEGTFAPVKAATVEGHRMDSEWYDLPAEAVEAIGRTRAAGGRIVAVGTTAVRVLESAAARGGEPAPHQAWTDIFIYPPYRFALTDAMITNFHLPASTLIMLVAAFCDPERQYRFYSYGDAMLIE